MAKYGIGQPVSRFEDRALLRGKGRFQNDVNLPGPGLHGVVLRSPHAHARIRALDTSAAQAAPGVLADLYRRRPRSRPGSARWGCRSSASGRTGRRCSPAPISGLAQGTVRYVGEPVAFVVAETLAQAKDAAELVAVDYETLPSVTDTAEAAEGKIAVWDECPDNISNLFEAGNKAATDAAFAQAAHIVRRRYVISRVYAHYMEPRGAIGGVGPGRGPLHPLRRRAIPAPGAPGARRPASSRSRRARIRVIAGDVGGGFGTKGWQYPEHRLVLLAAKKLAPAGQMDLRAQRGDPGRRARPRQRQRGRAGARQRRAGSSALRVKTLANVGAYISSERNLLATFGNVGTLTGVYDIPAAHVEVHGGDGQHQRHRALSRRRAARGDLCHRAPDRRRGARAGTTTRSNCAAAT